jgi:hypothetical protein
MPTIPASDYTAFIKAQAASVAYQNNKIPVPIQRVAQPYRNQSILNAQLLGSQVSALVTPGNSTLKLVNGQAQRVIPYNGKGNVNHPKDLSTVSYQSIGAEPGFTKSKQAGGAPLFAPKSSMGTYYAPAHTAQVDTKWTGANADNINAPGGPTNNPAGNVNPH